MVYPPNLQLSKIRVRRAIFSCYNKTGLVKFAQALVNLGKIKLIASGGTAKRLRDSGLIVTPIEDITGFPEMPGGLVKTLHPKIHGSLLAEVDPNQFKQDVSKGEILNQDQIRYLKDQSISLIDLVVCNLYPFREAVQKRDSLENCRSQIDIGGPTLIRSAAKNFPRVAVLTHPQQYKEFIDLLKTQEWCTTFEQRFKLAKQAFQVISEYDYAISNYLKSVSREIQNISFEENK